MLTTVPIINSIEFLYMKWKADGNQTNRNFHWSERVWVNYFIWNILIEICSIRINWKWSWQLTYCMCKDLLICWLNLKKRRVVKLCEYYNVISNICNIWYEFFINPTKFSFYYWNKFMNVRISKKKINTRNFIPEFRLKYKHTSDQRKRRLRIEKSFNFLWTLYIQCTNSISNGH